MRDLCGQIVGSFSFMDLHKCCGLTNKAGGGGREVRARTMTGQKGSKCLGLKRCTKKGKNMTTRIRYIGLYRNCKSIYIFYINPSINCNIMLFYIQLFVSFICFNSFRCLLCFKF